ncbi:class I SAM-dependent methyltransferase [Actinoplanes sp. KI2]|uniref:class I SAM-dependent methyltransferase n=1 Tax=Actinoplanes sp. KI2 TaxID=2983315 RepID=UPI0021D5B69E|nr:class I SAM-dependent methyltransferase [Actinoplanes sp. KI2]MCU7728894.1 class I SAM-dependent methyltransferase [Actinoplanes sp. KI2]
MTSAKQDIEPGASAIGVDEIVALYRKYRDDLAVVRNEQRALRAANPALKAQLDDLEAEITYLLIRETRPANMVEIGSLHGWSTNWILRALRDNGMGHLHTYDLIDNARHNVAPELADERWTFVRGDARNELALYDRKIDYLFIDAAHTASFARWFVGDLFPLLRSDVPVSVHDVFHGRRPWPVSEGRVVLSWLADAGLDHFTVSRAAAPRHHRRITGLKDELGLAAPVHTGRHNPMLFFRTA